VKNLPASTSVSDVRTLFAQSGVVTDVLLAPSHTSCIIEFEQPSEARTALKKLAYKAFDGTPLYVGWAPSRTEDSEDEVETGTIFVKNLSFSTSKHDLERHFGTAGKVRSVVFPGKADDGFANRGYGFVEFSSSVTQRDFLQFLNLKLRRRRPRHDHPRVYASRATPSVHTGPRTRPKH